MIAVLHKNSVVGLLLDEVRAVDGDSIQTATGGAYGVTHDVLIVDGFTYGEDVTPPVYDEDEQLVTPEIRTPFIQNGDEKISVGDTINPASLTDMRSSLPMTEAQLDKQRIADLELVIADAYERGIL